jgi:peptide-methionine (R)-S-oxide reductase
MKSASGYDLTPLSSAEIDALAARLTPEERHVVLNQGTERPFCGTLLDNKREGTYACRLCGLPLFRSTAKFDSGTGWPSFYEPTDPQHIASISDVSHGMTRVEIRCARCDAHLGHVFEDGPAPTGLRYCLNSVSLDFVGAGEEPVDRAAELRVRS